MQTLIRNPELIALAVLVVGVAIALGIRGALSRLSGRAAPGSALAGTVLAITPFVFWTVVLAAIVLALNFLGTGQASGLVEEALRFLPRLFVAVLVACAGHVIGVALRETLNRRGWVSILPPRGAYWLAAGPALIVAVQQLGVEVSFVADLALVALTVALGALGLAFALGARQFVANLIARRELDNYPEGTRLRIDGIEGIVVEVHRTGLVLSTPEGLAAIPAARFADAVVVRLGDEAE